MMALPQMVHGLPTATTAGFTMSQASTTTAMDTLLPITMTISTMIMIRAAMMTTMATSPAISISLTTAATTTLTLPTVTPQDGTVQTLSMKPSRASSKEAAKVLARTSPRGKASNRLAASAPNAVASGIALRIVLQATRPMTPRSTMATMTGTMTMTTTSMEAERAKAKESFDDVLRTKAMARATARVLAAMADLFLVLLSKEKVTVEKMAARVLAKDAMVKAKEKESVPTSPKVTIPHSFLAQANRMSTS